MRLSPGNPYRRGTPSTVNLLVKKAIFWKKEKNIFTIKRSWSELVSTRRATVLSLPLQWGFPALTNGKCRRLNWLPQVFVNKKEMLADMAVHGWAWLCMAVHGCAWQTWLCMAVYGCACILKVFAKIRFPRGVANKIKALPWELNSSRSFKGSDESKKMKISKICNFVILRCIFFTKNLPLEHSKSKWTSTSHF